MAVQHTEQIVLTGHEAGTSELLASIAQRTDTAQVCLKDRIDVNCAQAEEGSSHLQLRRIGRLLIMYQLSTGA